MCFLFLLRKAKMQELKIFAPLTLLSAFDSSRPVNWIGPALIAAYSQLNFHDVLCTRTLACLV